MGSIAEADAQFSRRELFIWLASILCASAFAQSMTHGGTTALSLESIGAFQILGWFAVLRLLYLQHRPPPVAPRLLGGGRCRRDRSSAERQGDLDRGDARGPLYLRGE